MQIGFLFDADTDPDADPGYHKDVDPCGSGSTTLTGIYFRNFYVLLLPCVAFRLLCTVLFLIGTNKFAR
jgi:hypothetical protein